MSRAQIAVTVAVIATVLGRVSPRAGAGNLLLLFQGYADGHSRAATATIEAVGVTNIREVPFSSGGELSPSGRQIAFDTCRAGNRGIAVAPLDTADVDVIAPVAGAACVFVRWSPDSARVSYAGAHDFLIHIVDLVTRVDTPLPNTFFAPGWHSWSPNGDAIAYETGRGGTRRIDVIDLTTWRTRPLVGPEQFRACEVWAPDWSPTGESIAFTTCDRRLYIVNASGRELRQLTSDAYAPRWTPDGTSVLFLTAGTLRRVFVASGRVEQIGRLPFAGGPFSLAPIR